MKQIASIPGRIVWVAMIVVLTIVRIALAAVLTLIAPLVLPLLTLLSGGGLVIAAAFALAGKWHQALMAGWACLICTVTLMVFAALVQLVNPYAFSVPVRLTNPQGE